MLSLTILTNHPFYLRSISSHIFPVWDEPWSFHNTCYLVLFCLDLSRTGAAADIITRLATSPQFPCTLPSSQPSSQFNLGVTALVSGVSLAQKQAPVSAAGLAHVLTGSTTLSALEYQWHMYADLGKLKF